MKKVSLLFVAALISLATFSQEFMGIKVDGTKEQLVAKFSQKGFTKKNELNGVLILKGQINSVDVEVYCNFTAKSKKCWKFSVWMPERTSWYSLKADFDKYVEVLTEKYGKPEKEYAFFMSPYKDDDGYQMTAVAVDKCRYLAFWKEYYSVEITKFKQVKINYENPINSALDDKERSEVDSNTF